MPGPTAPPMTALRRWSACQVSSYAPSKAVPLMYLLSHLPAVGPNTFHPSNISLHGTDDCQRHISVHQWSINLSKSRWQDLLLLYQHTVMQYCGRTIWLQQHNEIKNTVLNTFKQSVTRRGTGRKTAVKRHFYLLQHCLCVYSSIPWRCIGELRCRSTYS
jgi:hypothetical protein